MKYTVYKFDPRGKVPNFQIFDNYEEAKQYAKSLLSQKGKISVWIEGLEVLRDNFNFIKGDAFPEGKTRKPEQLTLF